MDFLYRVRIWARGDRYGWNLWGQCGLLPRATRDFGALTPSNLDAGATSLFVRTVSIAFPCVHSDQLRGRRETKACEGTVGCAAHQHIGCHE